MLKTTKSGKGSAKRRKPTTSPTARARRDRSGDTRLRLIEAGIDVFGRYGYWGATTRQIAKAANANLAAIVYHFGSKDALYLAVAEHLVASIEARIGPVMTFVQANMPRTPPESAALLKRMLEAFVDVVLGSPEAQRWARFIVREMLDPTEAFEIVYTLIGRVHRLITEIVAIAVDADPEATETKLRAFTVIGQGIVFRVANAVVLRRIDRPALGPDELAQIKRILAQNIDAILTGGDHARSRA